MALVVADRVKETTNSTGTGSYALGGASPGFQAFSVVTSNADTVYYSITDNVNYEVGIGAYASSGNSISRTTIFSSSNSNNAVNWGVGTKDIFLTYPADKAVIEDVSNNVTIGNNLIVGGTVDGVDIQTLNTTANAALPKAGGTMSGNLILNADPTIALQSATKQYVDTIAAAGIHYHQACRAETTANLNATYSNGSSGVGATLTNAGTQAAIVLDGVTLSATNRVMVQDQTNQAHNGVYIVTTVGSASTNWVLTRATDADSYSPSDPDALGEGDAFFITEGTVHGGELDVMTTTGVITFGTTNIVFALVSDAPIYTAGTGLSISGTEFSLVTPVTSATALATARTIGMTGDVVWTSASFDGTGNVTGTATIQANSVALGTDTTGNYVGAGATSGTGISGSLSAEGGTFTVASNATNANTASTIVARDGSGNFSAGTVTGALSGNASTATALATGRTIGMTGDVVWTSASFDGTGNVTGTATIQPNSVALGTDTTGNYVSSIANGSYLTGGGSASENKAYTLGVDATSANTASKVVARNGSGNFSAGTVTAALSGNASTATTLQTARTINGVAFNGAANITVADSTKLPKAGGAMTGAITTNSTFDGRNVSVDGTKLDGIASGAQVNVSPGNATITIGGDVTANSGFTTNQATNEAISLSLNANTVDSNELVANSVDASHLNVSGNGTSSQWLRSDGDGTMSWVTPPNTVYSLPLATSTARGGIELYSNTDQTVAPNTVTATASRTYGLQLNSANQAMVNVPWVNTTYSVGAGGLTQQNFTTTLKNKLDGVATSANNYSFPYTVSNSAGNSTVVQRNASGYIFGNWLNATGTFATSANSSGMGRFTGTNGADTYGRSYTAAAARTLLNVADGANNYSLPASPSFTDLYVSTNIYHSGDTNTYMQFTADTWRVITGGTTRMVVDNSTTTMTNTLSMSGHIIDMNNNAIRGVDAIYHEGDTNTYMQFHEPDQWRVVTGGVERLEVNNFAVTSIEPIYAPSFHGDGSNLTGVGGSTTAGAVGTYCWARNTGSATTASTGTGSSFNFGTTYAGTGLFPAGFSGEAVGNFGNAWYYNYTSGVAVGSNANSALSGTWRCMGQTSIASPYYDEVPVTLFVRIS